MSNIIKALSLAIVILLVFCSCQSEKADNIPEFETVYTSGDLEGIDITFLGDFEKFFGYVDYTTSYDRLAERIKEVEKTYNCNISYEYKSNLSDLVMASYAAGTDLCDALYMDAKNFRMLCAGGYMLDLACYADIIDVNDSFRWGTRNILEICGYGGHLYGVTPAAWVDKLPPLYFFLLTNNDIITRNGFNHPHEYYENKTWSREIFSDMVSTCADPERGIYGLDTSNAFIGRMAVYSDGLSLIDSTSDTPQSSWHNSIVRDDLQWAADFVNANREYITQGGENYSEFIDGNSAMAMPDISKFCRKIIYSTAVKEYSIMPFPCSSASAPGTCGGFFSTGIEIISMPVLTTNEKETATVINAVFAPMEGLETQDLLDSYYSSNLFYSKTDLEIVRNCVEKSRYNYWVEKVFTPLESIINDVMNGTSSPSQAIEAHIEAADEAILNIVLPNEEGLQNYFDN
jgi:hypothetical protein